MDGEPFVICRCDFRVLDLVRLWATDLSVWVGHSPGRNGPVFFFPFKLNHTAHAPSPDCTVHLSSKMTSNPNIPVYDYASIYSKSLISDVYIISQTYCLQEF